MAEEEKNIPIDIKQLPTDMLQQLMHALGMEFANRPKSNPQESPKEAYFFTPEPSFQMGVQDGKLVLRIQSSFYDWVSFQISLEGAIAMREMLDKHIATGAITPRSVPFANVMQKGAKH